MQRSISIIRILFLLLITIVTNPSPANVVQSAAQTYGTYSDAVEMVRESMRSYYMRGPKIQYNYAKTSYPIGSPEEATEQDTNYSVCAAYTYSVYSEAFGIKYISGVSEFPRYNYDIINVAKDAYSKNQKDGKLLIYYQNTKDKTKYIYGDTTTSNSDDFDTLVKQVKPGDLFVYTGHALIAYGVEINPKTGKKDILILNSTQKQKIFNRIEGTSGLTHNMFESNRNSTGILDKIPEGTVQFFWLSDSSYFMDQKTGKFECQKDECAIVRVFYDENGQAKFNYQIDESKYKKGKLRTEYPGLYIEKIVNVGDNNSVNINDQLTYTIRVTNRSTIQPKNSKNYTTPFYISENIDGSTSFVSATNSGTHSNNKVTWKINSLNAGQTIELKYTVKVKDNPSNVSKTINSTGVFYSSKNTAVTIPTGTVKNKIISKATKLKNSYQSCYDTNQSKYTDLTLINEIYKCATGTDFKFTELNFDNMFTKTIGNTPKSQSKVALNANATSTSKQFNSMILNDYFNGLAITNNEYYLPRIPSSPRAREINARDFKNGDVLIYSITNSKYTSESGIYAYIYLNGKFIGKNKTGSAARNTFEYTYYTDIENKLYQGYSKLTDSNRANVLTYVNYQTLYDKDNYVILRPEQVITEPYKITVTKSPTKQQYVINKEKLNLYGGELTITNNNGTTKKINLNDTKVKVTNFDNTKQGKITLTVTYENLVTTFDVEIIPKAITSMAISSLPTKLKYKQNIEVLNLKGGKIDITYNDNSAKVINMTDNNVKVTGFNNTIPGKNVLTVTCEGKSATFEVEILPKQLDKIELIQNPIKNKYIKGTETLDLTGGKLKIIYNDKSTEEIDINNPNVKVTGFDNTKIGKNTITITYNNKTTKFTVEIIDGEKTVIRVSQPPTKLKYILNQETLNLIGGTIEIIYKDRKEIISLTDENIKVENFNNTSVGKNTITITYKNYKTTMDVEIISKEIRELQINELPKYKNKVTKKEELELITGSIKAIYTDGTSDIIKMTDKNINIISFDNSVPGISKVNLKYLNQNLLFELKYDIEKENTNTEINNDSENETIKTHKKPIYLFAIAMIITGVVFSIVPTSKNKKDNN